GGLGIVREGAPCTNDTIAPADREGCAEITREAYFDDLSNYLEDLSSKMKMPSDWCGPEPAENGGLCARAFAYWVYDMRCQYAKQRQTGLPSRRAMGIFTNESEEFGGSVDRIFATSGFEAPDFDPQNCLGQIPKK